MRRAIIIAGSGYVDGQQEAEARRLLATYQRNGGRAAVIGRHQLGVDALLPDNPGPQCCVGPSIWCDLGHTDVAIISGPEALTTVARPARRRGRGVRRGRGPPPRGVDRLHGRGAGPAAIDALRRWPETTAILALNDSMAIAILRGAARRIGVSVPGDVSVAGFDDVAGGGTALSRA